MPFDRPGAQVLETDVFGYLNADAAWAVQGLAAAALVVVAARRTGSRVLGVVLMAALGLQPLLTGSWAAVLGGVLVAAAALVALPARRVAAAGLAALVAVVGVTAGLAVAHDANPDLTDPAARVLTERRLDLWADAVGLAADHPVTGVGAGRFEEESATARASRDTKPAHSTWLEAAAETGLPGGLLLVALALWPLAAVGTGRAAAVGAAAWTAFCLHASVDYVTDTGRRRRARRAGRRPGVAPTPSAAVTVPFDDNGGYPLRNRASLTTGFTAHPATAGLPTSRGSEQLDVAEGQAVGGTSGG